jgi:putative CocE/NonD family hydrolase
VEERRAWIPTRDGVRLALRLWLPEELPAPVVLEANPYRMDDLTASYAGEYERLCHEGGLAVARLDVRGTGSSGGIAEDEYTQDEHDDIVETIAWLAAQGWSNGRVGMYGTSWSGFNSLQVACLRPPALGAICAIYASDDRYTDDVHYMGGILKAVDLVDWELYMAACNALPPVPAVVGKGWRDEWAGRLEQEPWLLGWLARQRDDSYWRHGSLRPGYDRIACPTLLVGGWADGYRNNTLRTFAALRCERRLLVGPWSHMSTATSLPGPQLDLVPELVRWFGRWLRDDENGLDDEPPIRVFVRRSTRPAPDLTVVEGEWRFEPGWPPERSRTVVLRPSGEGLDVVPVEGDLGTAAWISCAGKLPWGQPDDQRSDDARSLVYDWAPLERELEVLGHARVEVVVTSSEPVAFLSARLCDVFEDGTSALVARGVLNLAHRDSSAEPAPLEPGSPTPVSVELEATSWALLPGHRLRLALTGADWPNTWPPPRAAELTVDRSTVALSLPVVDGPAPIPDTPRFSPPPPREEAGDGSDDPVTWRLERDVLERETRVVTGYGWAYEGPFGARIRERYDGTVGVSPQEPGRAWARGTARYEIVWPEATVVTEARLELRSDADAYHVAVDVFAEEVGDAPEGFGRRTRRYERTIPRDLQ